MWESVSNYPEEVNMDIVSIGGKKSRKHLHSVAASFVEKGLPMCLAVPLFSRVIRTFETEADHCGCQTCGLDFSLSKSFVLNVQETKGSRMLKAVCRGCGSNLSCGKVPDLREFDNEKTSDLAVDVPMTSSKTSTSSLPPSSPAVIKTPKVVSLQNSSKAKKRRGSALQRLLQEEESESDRSLSGFLSQFASQ